jgi:hypothetical protein
MVPSGEGAELFEAKVTEFHKNVRKLGNCHAIKS